jgi:hypothetical protein
VPHFLEEQRFRQFWVYLLLAIPVVIMWWGFLEQIILGRQWGDRPAPNWVVILTWLLFGIGLPGFFWMLRMNTRVDGTGVEVRWSPIKSGATVAYSEIECHESITYRPIREFGGWGVRWGGKQRRAYNVSGDRGVELFLTDGRSIVVGSERSDELANAIAVGAAEAATGR